RPGARRPDASLRDARGGRSCRRGRDLGADAGAVPQPPGACPPGPRLPHPGAGHGRRPGVKLAVLAFDSIRAGRDGSEQSPFEVLRVADEYDVLSSSGLRSTGQELRPTDYGEADVHTLAGGGELWFRLLWRDAPTA